MPEVDLLDYLRDWQRRHVRAAGARGVALTFGGTPADRPKPAVWVTAATADEEAQLMVWVTGEAEYAARRADRVVANEHHDIETTSQLDTLLGRLLEDVGAG